MKATHTNGYCFRLKRMKKNSLLFIATIFSISLTAQKLQVTVNYVTPSPTAASPSIPYKNAVLLKWNDFKASPNFQSNAAAITSAGFGYKMNFRAQGDEAFLNIMVHCTFSPNESWVKPNHKTDYILNHEQHHFDIAYIQTMRFIGNLKATTFTRQNYTQQIEQLYNQAQLDLTQMQTTYDGETKNSQLNNEQAQWNKKVEAQIKAFSK